MLPQKVVEAESITGPKRTSKINGQQVHKLILKAKGRDGPSNNPNPITMDVVGM